MKVEDVMTPEVHTCRLDSNLSMVAMQMWDGDFGVVPVENAGRIVGMITDRDICMAAAIKHRDPAEIQVEEVISGQVHSCAPDADIREALKTMERNKVRRLPVIDAGKLVGVLSLNDVVQKAQNDGKAELNAQDVENTLKTICEHCVPPPVAVPLQQITRQLAA